MFTANIKRYDAVEVHFTKIYTTRRLPNAEVEKPNTELKCLILDSHAYPEPPILKIDPQFFNFEPKIMICIKNSTLFGITFLIFWLLQGTSTKLRSS